MQNFEYTCLFSLWASLVAQKVKCLPAMQETWDRFLGWEDPLEKEMANPLQHSCLENSMEWKPGRLQVHGVAKSQTRLSDFTLTIIFFVNCTFYHCTFYHCCFIYKQINFKKILDIP